MTSIFSFKLFKRSVLTSVCFLLLSITFVSAKTADDTLVIAALIDDLITLEPAAIFEFTGAEYASNTYDRLIGYDINNYKKLYGVIAESWEISRDKRTYVFSIRKNVKFASGNRLTAQDVAFSLQRVILLNKAPAFILTQFGFTKENVRQKIKAVDDYLVKIRINKPYAPTFFLNCLTSNLGSVVDKKLVLTHERKGDLGSNWLRTNYAGSGPYILEEWIPSRHIKYIRNENYWGEKAKLKKVHVIHVNGLKQQPLLEQGKIDIARDLQPKDIKQVTQIKGIDVVKRAKGSIYYLGLNQKNLYLRKPPVRQALKYLVDYYKIAGTILDGKATVHQSFLPSTFLGGLNENPFQLDIARAKLYLKDAGLINGFEITLDTRNSEPYISIAKSIQQTFSKANVRLKIVKNTGTDSLLKYRNRQHDIYLGIWGTDYMDPHTNASTFASNPNNGDNANSKTLCWRNAWDIPAMTAMTDATLLESNITKREKMYQEIQRIHQLTSPFIVMFQQNENLVKHSRIRNVILGPNFDTHLYKNITK